MGKNDWYKKWFNTGDYLKLYKHRNSTDASKVVSLIFKNIHPAKGACVLDLACGNGRHSVLFAKKGYSTLGIDLSPHMIKTAKLSYSGKYGKTLKFEIGDMRKIGHKNEFDLVVNLFSSFGYFNKKSENEKVIRSVSASLKKKGYFFFDFFNSAYLIKKLVPFTYEKREKEVILQIRNIKDSFINKTILIFERSGDNTTGKYKQFNEQVRLFDEKDFNVMFKKHGLKIIKKIGDYSGKPYEKNKSERLIILAQKV